MYHNKIIYVYNFKNILETFQAIYVSFREGLCTISRLFMNQFKLGPAFRNSGTVQTVHWIEKLCSESKLAFYESGTRLRVADHRGHILYSRKSYNYGLSTNSKKNFDLMRPLGVKCRSQHSKRLKSNNWKRYEIERWGQWKSGKNLKIIYDEKDVAFKWPLEGQRSRSNPKMFEVKLLKISIRDRARWYQ